MANILDNIPVEYKEMVISILKIPEIKEALENNDFELFNKLLRGLKSKNFAKLSGVFDRPGEKSKYGDYYVNFIVKINGKDEVVEANNEGNGCIASGIKGLCLKIINMMIHESKWLVNDSVLTPNQYENNKDLTEYTVAPNILEIPANCFRGCTNLEKIDLGYVKKIGSEAFRDCSSLKEFIFPETLERIPGGMNVDGCDSVERVTILNPKVKFGVGCFDFKNLKEIRTVNIKPLISNPSKWFDLFNTNTKVLYTDTIPDDLPKNWTPIKLTQI